MLISLGLWQLERADEKRQLQESYAQRASMPALTMIDLDKFHRKDNLQNHDDIEAFHIKSQALGYRRLQITGKFDNEHTFLLDNQILHGEVGYQVLAPFVTKLGQALLVNRGWIRGYPDRRLPVIPALPDTEVSLLVSIYVPLSDAIVLNESQWPTTWPIVVQSIDIARASSALGVNLFDYSVRLLPGYPGSLKIDWPVVNTGPEKHMGYAVQWFFMALALGIYWLYSSISQQSANTIDK